MPVPKKSGNLLKAQRTYIIHIMKIIVLLFNSLIVFHGSLSDKSPQVTRTLLYILSDLNNAVVWMVWILLISNSSSLFSIPLGNLPSKPSTIGITVTPPMIYSFLISHERSKYLSIFFAFFYFHFVVHWNGKNSLDGKFSFYLFN